MRAARALGFDVEFAGWTAAAAVAVGIAVSLSIGLVVVTVAVAVVAGLLFAVFAGVATNRVRLVDAIVGALIIWLPLTPYLLLSGLGLLAGASRFLLAGVLIAGIVTRNIPVKHPSALGIAGWLLVAFGAYQLVPLAVAGVTPEALLRTANWVMFIPLAFVQFDSRLRRVVVIAAGIAVAILVVGLALQYWGMIGGTSGGIQVSGGLARPEYQRRYSSFLQEPNAFALSMVAALLVFYAVFVDRKTVLVRGVALVMIVVCLVGVFASVSRGALIALPVALLFQASTGHWRSVLRLVLALVVIGIAALAVLPAARSGLESGVSAVAHLTSGQDESVELRRQVLAERISRSGNPIIGAGYGGYTGLQDPRAAGNRHLALRLQGVDNGWLKLWLEEGAIGVFLLGGVLIVAIRRSMWGHATDGHRVTGSIVGALLVIILFRSLSNDILDINPWNSLTWIVVGCALSLPVNEAVASRVSETSARRPTPSDAPPSLA